MSSSFISKDQHLKLRAVDILDQKIERRIYPAGEYLPDIDVTTFDGVTTKISDYYKNKKPLLLVFLRASWWPYCRANVEMLNGMASTFKSIGCDIVAVSRETPEESSFKSGYVWWFDIFKK